MGLTIIGEGVERQGGDKDQEPRSRLPSAVSQERATKGSEGRMESGRDGLDAGRTHLQGSKEKREVAENACRQISEVPVTRKVRIWAPARASRGVGEQEQEKGVRSRRCSPGLECGGKGRSFPPRSLPRMRTTRSRRCKAGEDRGQVGFDGVGQEGRLGVRMGNMSQLQALRKPAPSTEPVDVSTSSVGAMRAVGGEGGQEQ